MAFSHFMSFSLRWNLHDFDDRLGLHMGHRATKQKLSFLMGHRNSVFAA